MERYAYIAVISYFGVESLHLFQILFHKGFQSLKNGLLKKQLNIFKYLRKKGEKN